MGAGRRALVRARPRRARDERQLGLIGDRGADTATAVEHTRTVADVGLLRELALSGATDAETAWGPAWGDMHIPPRGDAPALAASAASLLGQDEIATRPHDADVATRLAIITATIDQVVAARETLAVAR